MSMKTVFLEYLRIRCVYHSFENEISLHSTVIPKVQCVDTDAFSLSVSDDNQKLDNVTIIYETDGGRKVRYFLLETVDKSYEDGVIAYLFFLCIISTFFNFLILILYIKNKNLHR